MGASRPLVAIPDRLQMLAEADRGLPQPPVAVRPERWIRRIGGHADVIAGLPDQLDRARVRELVLACPPGGASALAGFIATQVWGHGRNGYGPARLALALADPGLASALQGARDRLKNPRPSGAFRVLVVEHQVPWIGMAFGSKYLYFADPSGRALILDRLIRDWLAEHAAVRLTGRRDEREYAVWLLLAEQWASALKLPPGRLEMIIFADGLTETSSWRPAEATPAQTGTTSERSNTCVDAIARVLEGAVDGMRAADIAREINRQGLYRRNDGQPLPAYQVSSLAHASGSRFRITDAVIALRTVAPARSDSSSVVRTPVSVGPPATRNRLPLPETHKVVLLG